MIEIINVSKSFGDTQVLYGIDFSFDKGKVNMIIGQSGHGKSVLMKCLVGLYQPETGKVLYKGKNFLEKKTGTGIINLNYL